MPDEIAAGYGAAPATGRHQLLDDWLAGHAPPDDTSAAAPLSLIYTSGTTGLAKGVLRDPVTPEHSSTLAAATLGAMGLQPGMSTLVTAPLYHAAPNAQALFAVALGIDLTIMPRFDAEDMLRLVERHRIAHAQAVPTMFVRLLELPEAVRERYDLGSLQVVVHAAAPCPVARQAEDDRLARPDRARVLRQQRDRRRGQMRQRGVAGARGHRRRPGGRCGDPDPRRRGPRAGARGDRRPSTSASPASSPASPTSTWRTSGARSTATGW